MKNLPDTKYNYYDLFDGAQRSSCLLPCSTHSVDSRQLSEEVTRRNVSVINLSFNQHVMVTTHYAIKFTFARFLSDVGGGLGLWLGLGLAQFLQGVVTWTLKLTRRNEKRSM